MAVVTNGKSQTLLNMRRFDKKLIGVIHTYNILYNRKIRTLRKISYIATLS